ncbi:hypothetical protein SAMN05661008_00591 [Alkalithermobacter thermoalcaliphilus JW-YL-7 = DSM 7308]|uniref:Uncharacterized protein n=1 Tax=Alkalithermobacter thermoalcaliphilus JW-YL-7 = DSM 7308 TaxID=1121328 RepID=A0A150FQ40_CLOPD|nr:hypothetical protein JWYL7_0806 [[Clostridium] paradoxum JW-YL-7 = DSM 7308]SHK63010.1 hypothetical protein SAMN05661008_00591 [[Clostridium] paradoxum JW-YL-7 = DSM 7308]
MDTKYVIIRSDTKSISKPMSRNEAILKVKEYDKDGISAYIVSEDEGNRIMKSEFNIPKW